ncbi:hypothetical protein PFY10_13900 [Chryseobacterium daecheongense]|nr:hypothetical protein PFY10_13900 [Chryseobacterium daecheongense]
MDSLDNLFEYIQKLQKDVDESFEDVDFYNSFSFIEMFEKEREINFSCYELDIFEQVAIIKKNPDKNRFEIEIKNIFFDVKKLYSLDLIIDKKNYHIEGVQFCTRPAKFIKNEENNVFEGQIIFYSYITSLCSGDFSLNCFNRCVIETPKFILSDYLQSNSFRFEGSLRATGNFRFTFNKQEFRIINFNNGKSDYIIIDSLDMINHNEFQLIVNSILICVGFITTNYYQNECYYFQSAQENFLNPDVYYKTLSKSILPEANYNPIYRNPYEDELIVFNRENFESLIGHVYRNDEFNYLILLFIEANNATLTLQPAGYSVALEKLTNIIALENNNLQPIEDKKKARIFIKKLNAVLEDCKNFIDENGSQDAFQILQKNIQNINKPTNKEKLLKPFEIYNVCLTKEDKKAIGARNDFLHGRTLRGEDNKIAQLEIFETSLRLNKVLNMLILKYIGYKGNMINYVKYYEKILRKNIEEDLFVNLN